MSYTAVIEAPPGRLGIVTTQGALQYVDYVDRRTGLLPPQDNTAKEVVDQLEHYFSDPRFTFTLTLKLAGTAHQQLVWRQLQQIGSGETLTYGELARQIDSGARAVGNSCRCNPISIVVPCHRVVSAKDIGGYGGHVDGKVIERKYWLLRHEGAIH